MPGGKRLLVKLNYYLYEYRTYGCNYSFSSTLKEPIKTLNIEWLSKYFKIEPKDELVLSNPQEEIIDKGGMIFYAKYNEVIVGTVSLLK
jgi:hypothetical protein